MSLQLPPDLPSQETILQILRQVEDPEIGLDIVALGLVYRVHTAPDAIHILMTMTTPTCPLSSMMVDEVEDVLRSLAPTADIQVELTWEPPWTSAMMTPEARVHFGWDGEAP